MLYYIILLIYILIIIILSEGGSYLWHRWGAHKDIVPGLHETHKIHHSADLSDQAHEDFYWVIVYLALIGIILLIFYKYFKKYIPIGSIYIVMGYVILVSVFVWNWYIHSAYHIEGHWLNRYDWFKRDKKLHFQHHINPKVNYGIASHFSDIIGGTFDFALSSNLKLI